MVPPDLPLPAFASVWTDASLAKAVALLARAFAIARDVGARPMLEGGTLLGHQRHDGRVIPWDDDVDLLVDARDFPRWMRALGDDPALMVAIREHPRFGTYGKVWWRADPPGTGAESRRRNGWPFVDMFRYDDRGATLAYCPDGRARRDWARELVLPAVDTAFEGVPVAIPRQADRLLDELYPNWRIVFDTGAWDHRRERRRAHRGRHRWNPAGGKPRRASTIVYADMCADLFHAGHVGFLRQARALGDRLVVGVHGDATIASYKRPPVQTLAERVAAVAACRHVDEVVPDAPLCVTPRYLDALGVRIVCHGDDLVPADFERMYRPIAATHRVVLVPYTHGISTRLLCERVIARADGEPQSSGPPDTSGTSRQ